MSRAALVLGLAGAFLLAGLGLLSIPARAARIPLVRVGLAVDAETVRLSSKSEWNLGLTGSGLRPTRIAGGKEWKLSGGPRGIEVRDEAGRLRGTATDTLFAFPDDPESGSVRLNGTSYRGQILVWNVGSRLTAVNVVDLESYISAVLPQELGPQPPERFEALKAQAVAARSYTLSVLGSRGSRGFDLLPTIDDQVYGGIPAERPICSDAVGETRGVIAVHAGNPIRAYYCSTCGGHTAAADEVWNRPAAAYLIGVQDVTSKVGDSFCSPSPFYRWNEDWDGAKFESMLARTLPRVRPDFTAARYGRLSGIRIEERSSSQRVARLRLQFSRKSVDLSGDEIRWVLRRPKTDDPLRSALLTSVQCKVKRGKVRSVRITGQGWGHGVGMCQFGAMGMASAGYSFDQIIHFYYHSAELRRYY